jgi:Ca2+-transporting ATPase
MTGYGSNDAPALRAASIGVAVGSGTEVAKEASDLVLIDNSFSVIVAAVEEGRRIIDNLKKIVAYLLSTSFSEIVLIAGALAAAGPLPLLPTQILWANIVSGDLMSFAFAFERGEKGAMKRDPRSARARNILTRELSWLVVILAVVTGLITLGLYYFLVSIDTPVEVIQTMMFVTISLDSLFFSFSLKSLTTPIWRIDVLSNKYLLWALGFSMGLLLLTLTWAPLQQLLSLADLSPYKMMLLLGVGIINLVAIECVKYYFFVRRQK